MKCYTYWLDFYITVLASTFYITVLASTKRVFSVKSSQQMQMKMFDWLPWQYKSMSYFCIFDKTGRGFIMHNYICISNNRYQYVAMVIAEWWSVLHSSMHCDCLHILWYDNIDFLWARKYALIGLTTQCWG